VAARFFIDWSASGAAYKPENGFGMGDPGASDVGKTFGPQSAKKNPFIKASIAGREGAGGWTIGEDDGAFTTNVPD
jgi:hypothetical protein